VSPVPEVVDRLSGAVESGELAELCVRTDVQLMVLFGSAARTPSSAADVDLAVSFGSGTGDQLQLLEELYRLTGYEGFDILDLDRAGAVARERALVGARLLHQARSGDFAERQIAAIMERMDTDEMRRVELELMAR
jgi:predicted nucleotidyltransferase